MKKLVLMSVTLVPFSAFNIMAQISVGLKMGMNMSMINKHHFLLVVKGFYLKVLSLELLLIMVLIITFPYKLKFYIPHAKVKSKSLKPVVITKNLIRNTPKFLALLKYTIGHNALKAFANAGPYFGYWTSGKYVWSDPEGVHNMNYTFENINLGTTTLKDNRLDVGFRWYWRYVCSR